MTKNILTVDLEDWRQSTFDPESSISEKVLENTCVLLDLLSRHNTEATFFCLGLVAEKYPQLIRDIHSAGHEIATHGWSHRSVKALGKEKFKEELNHSVCLLQDLCGAKVHGHRAPDFSIDLDMKWAFEIMREAGLRYDSSIFPIRGKRYGSPDSKVMPFEVIDDFMELPLSTVNIWGRRLAVLGGGYFRLYPYSLSSFFVKTINSENRPAIVYLHPYELEVDEFMDDDIPWKTKMHQGLFRSQVANRLNKILKEFEFISIRRYLGSWRSNKSKTVF